jgi:TrmH family RNA methyltransferase
MTLEDWKSKFAFVLLRPEFLGNIGSTARALKNFGFSDLRLVEAPKNFKDAEARKMSVGAFDILKAASNYDSLDEAVKERQFLLGTSSGKQRLKPLLDLKEALGEIPEGARVAFVLGDERNGMRADELDRCHLAVRIPTAEAFPSLNLAAAVAIIAYELSEYNRAAQVKVEPDLVSEAQTNEIIETLALLTEEIGFARKYNKEQNLLTVRQFFNKARASQREYEVLKGILHKAKLKLKEK